MKPRSLCENQLEEDCVLTTLDAIVGCRSDTFVSDYSSFILPSPPIKTSASLFTATNFDMYLLQHRNNWRVLLLCHKAMAFTLHYACSLWLNCFSGSILHGSFSVGVWRAHLTRVVNSCGCSDLINTKTIKDVSRFSRKSRCS